MDSVRGQRPKLTRLVLAFLVFWGMTGQGISAVLCSAGLCASKCGAAPKPAPEPPSAHGCCAEKKAKDSTAAEKTAEPTSGCCCKIESGADFTVPHAKVAISEPVLVIDLAPEHTPLLATVIRPAPEVYSFTDPSPPDRPISPDRGRAPPATVSA